MFVALTEALDELGATPGVRAVVLSGEGPSFCAGLDFASFISGDGDLGGDGFERPDGELANHAERVAHGWRELAVPVIAALRGASFGGGLQIALGTDIRIAAPDARLSVMEIRYGLVPDMSLVADAAFAGSRRCRPRARLHRPDRGSFRSTRARPRDPNRGRPRRRRAGAGG